MSRDIGCSSLEFGAAQLQPERLDSGIETQVGMPRKEETPPPQKAQGSRHTSQLFESLLKSAGYIPTQIIAYV